MDSVATPPFIFAMLTLLGCEEQFLVDRWCNSILQIEGDNHWFHFQIGVIKICIDGQFAILHFGRRLMLSILRVRCQICWCLFQYMLSVYRCVLKAFLNLILLLFYKRNIYICVNCSLEIRYIQIWILSELWCFNTICWSHWNQSFRLSCDVYFHTFLSTLSEFQ